MNARRESQRRGGRAARPWRRALTAVAAATLVGATACGGSGSGPAPAAPTAPTAPADAGAEQAAATALARLRDEDVTDAPPPSTSESASGDMDLKGPHHMHRIADPARRKRYERQLAGARKAAARYPTLGDAEAAGYIVTPFREPGVGVHAVNWSRVGDFDEQRPAMLLYDGMKPDAGLLALSYYIQSPSGRQPAGFVGRNDHWHNHVDICVADGALLPTVHQPDECARERGTYLTGRNLWMLHAWVVPGHTNPWGLFATYNPRLGDAADASS